METLKLVLKRKWFDMIASGEKKEEYRDLTKYWTKRILKDYPWLMVTFYLGYAKDRPSMTFTIASITVGEGKPEWGAESWKRYFVIKLGERI